MTRYGPQPYPLEPGPIVPDEDGDFVLFFDAQAALAEKDTEIGTLRDEVEGLAADVETFRAKSIELQKELDDAEILISNLRADINALREG